MYSYTNEKVDSPDAVAFRAWVRGAKPRETYVYYVGHLAENRMELTAIPAGKKAPEGATVQRLYDWEHNKYQYFTPREPLNSYATTVWEAYERGDVELVQRRDGDRFQYLAVRTRRH